MIDQPWARAVSLAVAAVISAVLMLVPFVLGTRVTPAMHATLPLTMFGVSAAFVHGIGYRPQHRAFALLFHPLVAWAAIGAGAVTFAAFGGLAA